MTVNTFAPAPVAEAPVEETATSRRTVLVAGGVAAALALGGAGYFLLSGGSDSSDEALAPSALPHRVAQPAVKKGTKPAVKPAVKVPVTSTVPLGRDPFHALYLQPAVSSVAPATGGSSTTTPPLSSPTTSGGSSTPSQPSQPTTTAPKYYKLVLTRVYGSGKETTGVFTVGGKTYVAKVGSVFGPTGELKLLSLSQDAKGVWTATLQVGDSEPVDAAKGETLYVR